MTTPDRPPEQVRTGILKGGPWDGLVMEIDPGQRVMDVTPLIEWGDAKLGSASYRYDGRLDAEGRAVFVGVAG